MRAGKLLFAHTAQRPLLLVGTQLGALALLADGFDVSAGAYLRPATFSAVIASRLVVRTHDAPENGWWTLLFAEHLVLGNRYPDVREIIGLLHTQCVLNDRGLKYEIKCIANLS